MAVLTDKTLLYLFKKIAGYADEYAGYQTADQNEQDIELSLIHI